MKLVNIIGGLFFVILFFVLVEIILKSGKTSGSVNYAPDGYLETMQAGINDRVINTEQKGLYWVTFKNGQKFPFSYDVDKMNVTSTIYPDNFISSGDSVYKKSNNDTFFIIRKGEKWLFVLPCCP